MTRRFMSMTMIMMAIILIVSMTLPVSASSRKGLQANKIYKCDLNGDGKKDKFKWKYDDEYGYTNLYLNGKKTQIFTARGCFVDLLKYSKKNTFIAVENAFYGGTEVTIYRYKGKKLKKVQVISLGDCNSVQQVKGKSLYIYSYPYRSRSNNDGFVTTYMLNKKKHKFYRIG